MSEAPISTLAPFSDDGAALVALLSRGTTTSVSANGSFYAALLEGGGRAFPVTPIALRHAVTPWLPMSPPHLFDSDLKLCKTALPGLFSTLGTTTVNAAVTPFVSGDVTALCSVDGPTQEQRAALRAAAAALPVFQRPGHSARNAKVALRPAVPPTSPFAQCSAPTAPLPVAAAVNRFQPRELGAVLDATPALVVAALGTCAAAQVAVLRTGQESGADGALAPEALEAALRPLDDLTALSLRGLSRCLSLPHVAAIAAGAGDRLVSLSLAGCSLPHSAVGALAQCTTLQVLSLNGALAGDGEMTDAEGYATLGRSRALAALDLGGCCVPSPLLVAFAFGAANPSTTEALAPPPPLEALCCSTADASAVAAVAFRFRATLVAADLGAPWVAVLAKLCPRLRVVRSSALVPPPPSDLPGDGRPGLAAPTGSVAWGVRQAADRFVAAAAALEAEEAKRAAWDQLCCSASPQRSSGTWPRSSVFVDGVEPSVRDAHIAYPNVRVLVLRDCHAEATVELCPHIAVLDLHGAPESVAVAIVRRLCAVKHRCIQAIDLGGLKGTAELLPLLVDLPRLRWVRSLAWWPDTPGLRAFCARAPSLVTVWYTYKGNKQPTTYYDGHLRKELGHPIVDRDDALEIVRDGTFVPPLLFLRQRSTKDAAAVGGTSDTSDLFCHMHDMCPTSAGKVDACAYWGYVLENAPLATQQRLPGEWNPRASTSVSHNTDREVMRIAQRSVARGMDSAAEGQCLFSSPVVAQFVWELFTPLPPLPLKPLYYDWR